MPKCINDETKKYRGDEPSPKGFGYSASVLEVGTKQKGQDENTWIVGKTSLGNRWIKDKQIKFKRDGQKYLYLFESDTNESLWQEFDFSNLPEDCYKFAYTPVCEEITKETGLEEKFGGNLPFLIEGQELPENLFLLCQFKDPRNKDNIMYQVFINDDYDYEIKKINMTKDNIKKQKIIECESKFKPYKITSWTKTKELISFDKLEKKFSFGKLSDKLCDMYYSHENCPSTEIKVGGTPMSTQCSDFNNMDLLQLAQCTILEFEWGDTGIAHVSTDLILEWDCC
jgi:hypothetical protein